jgi:magnesium transporter
MITLFQTTAQGIAEVETVTPGCWVHAADPTPEECARLRDEFGIPEDFVTAALDVDELARTDHEDDKTLIILLVPYVYSEDPADVPFSTTPLGIVLLNNAIVTISRVRTHFVAEFNKRYGRTISTAKRNRLVLRMFLAAAQQYLAFLRQVDAKTDEIQRQIQISLKNKELLELLRYQKSLIYFRTSLESNGLMMRRLQRSQLFEMYPEDQDLLEDVLTENAQATEVTKISSDILNQMMDAYASIISNNLNDVMKLLALATIILAIPTLIASLYGMNVPLPGQESVWAFATILVVSLVIITIVGFIIWRRRWL